MAHNKYLTKHLHTNSHIHNNLLVTRNKDWNTREDGKINGEKLTGQSKLLYTLNKFSTPYISVYPNVKYILSKPTCYGNPKSIIPLLFKHNFTDILPCTPIENIIHSSIFFHLSNNISINQLLCASINQFILPSTHPQQVTSTCSQPMLILPERVSGVGWWVKVHRVGWLHSRGLKILGLLLKNWPLLKQTPTYLHHRPAVVFKILCSIKTSINCSRKQRELLTCLLIQPSINDQPGSQWCIHPIISLIQLQAKHLTVHTYCLRLWAKWAHQPKWLNSPSSTKQISKRWMSTPRKSTETLADSKQSLKSSSPFLLKAGHLMKINGLYNQ